MIPAVLTFTDLYGHQAAMLTVLGVALIGVLVAAFLSDR